MNFINPLKGAWRALMLVGALGMAVSLAACDDHSSSSGSGSQSNSTYSSGSASAATNTPTQSQPATAAPSPYALPDGVVAQVSDARNIYIVFDGSGSMWNCPPDRTYDGKCKRKIIGAKWAVTEMVKKLPADVNIGLYVFDNNGDRERVALGPNNKDKVLAAVDRINANNGTPLGAAVASGVKALNIQYAKQMGYGEYRLVVVTDGLPDSMADLNVALKGMTSAPAPIGLYTIGFGIEDPNHPLRQYSVIYTAAESETQVKDALQQAASELDSFDSTDFKK